MTTKNSQKKQAKRGPEEARSRLLMLISGQKGLLPIDNTDGEIQSSASDANSEPPYQDLIQNMMKNNPALTEEKAQKWIDAFG
jgi:hypothetical protein